MTDTPPTCATCKHWESLADLSDVPRTLNDEGEYDWRNERAEGDRGYCTKVGEFGPRKTGRFYVIDGSEFMAKLGTRGDFGCVEHEPEHPGATAARSFGRLFDALNLTKPKD